MEVNGTHLHAMHKYFVERLTDVVQTSDTVQSYNKIMDPQEGWSVNSAGSWDEATGICEVLMHCSGVIWQTNTENESAVKRIGEKGALAVGVCFP